MADRGIFNLQNPNDLAKIQLMLLDPPEAIEDNGDERDTNSEDKVEERKENSESEQDVSSSSEEDEIEGDFYLGKDKITKWYSSKPNSRVKRGSHNVLLRLPGVIGEAKNASSPSECWQCFFSNEMLESIVTFTNIYIKIIQPRFQRERDAKITDLTKFKAFVGLLYHIGVLRGNRQSLEELWGEDDDGIERFRFVMNLKRFKFLIRCTRFDDATTREERKKCDKLASVREMFELFVGNCQKSYSIGKDVTVDEKLEGFRGRCSFRQYIPSKPNKYGLKIYSSVDAKMFYTHNLEIYAGKQPVGPYNVSNKPKDVVSRLVKPLFGSGRNITCDNWFPSLELLPFLKQNKLSLVGTIRKNKQQLSREFVNTKTRAVMSNKFSFSKDCTLVSFIPKKGKNVLTISSVHYDDEVNKETGKAEIIHDNSTKSGVDVVDKLCATYNVAINVRRWPMVIFFALLNVAGINSQIISIANNNMGLPKHKNRRSYLKTLAKELCLEQLQRRSMQTSGMPLELQAKLRQFQPVQEKNNSQPPCHDGNRKRCSKCREQKKVRYSKYACKKCISIYFCLEHSNMVCDTCYSSIFDDVNDNENYSD